MKPVFSRIPLRLSALLLTLTLAACAGTSPRNEAIYAAPDGKASNTGRAESPLDIHTAVELAEPGRTILMKGGVYRLDRPVELKRSGTDSLPIRLWACPGERPVFDCLDQPYNTSRDGMIVSGDYWHVLGLEIRNAYHTGFFIGEGSHNLFERCTAHHNGGTGFRMGFSHNEPYNEDGEKAAYNTFLNCDAYNNFDWYARRDGKLTAGTNTDGFACQCNTGKGNRFVGCRAWSNSDDGWDLFECGYGIVLENCWVWNTGILEDHRAMYAEKTGEELTEDKWDGNGNGFKMGGGCGYIGGRECTQISRGTHVLRGCIAFRNASAGFDQNDHVFGSRIEHCIGFDNGTNFNYYKANRDSTSFVFYNNVSWGGSRPDRFDRITYVHAGNSWDLPGPAAGAASQFIRTDTEAALAPRERDGSLPDGFCRPKPDSYFTDRGVATGPVRIERDGIEMDERPFSGHRPDPGVYELK